jgi:hypothetical protein
MDEEVDPHGEEEGAARRPQLSPLVPAQRTESKGSTPGSPTTTGSTTDDDDDGNSELEDTRLFLGSVEGEDPFPATRLQPPAAIIQRDDDDRAPRVLDAMAENAPQVRRMSSFSSRAAAAGLKTVLPRRKVSLLDDEDNAQPTTAVVELSGSRRGSLSGGLLSASGHMDGKLSADGVPSLGSTMVSQSGGGGGGGLSGSPGAGGGSHTPTTTPTGTSNTRGPGQSFVSTPGSQSRALSPSMVQSDKQRRLQSPSEKDHRSHGLGSSSSSGGTAASAKRRAEDPFVTLHFGRHRTRDLLSEGHDLNGDGRREPPVPSTIDEYRDRMNQLLSNYDFGPIDFDRERKRSKREKSKERQRILAAEERRILEEQQRAAMEVTFRNKRFTSLPVGTSPQYSTVQQSERFSPSSRQTLRQSPQAIHRKLLDEERAPVPLSRTQRFETMLANVSNLEDLPMATTISDSKQRKQPTAQRGTDAGSRVGADPLGRTLGSPVTTPNGKEKEDQLQMTSLTSTPTQKPISGTPTQPPRLHLQKNQAVTAAVSPPKFKRRPLSPESLRRIYRTTDLLDQPERLLAPAVPKNAVLCSNVDETYTAHELCALVRADRRELTTFPLYTIDELTENETELLRRGEDDYTTTFSVNKNRRILFGDPSGRQTSPAKSSGAAHMSTPPSAFRQRLAWYESAKEKVPVKCMSASSTPTSSPKPAASPGNRSATPKKVKVVHLASLHTDPHQESWLTAPPETPDHSPVCAGPKTPSHAGRTYLNGDKTRTPLTDRTSQLCTTKNGLFAVSEVHLAQRRDVALPVASTFTVPPPVSHAPGRGTSPTLPASTPGTPSLRKSDVRFPGGGPGETTPQLAPAASAGAASGNSQDGTPNSSFRAREGKSFFDQLIKAGAR